MVVNQNKLKSKIIEDKDFFKKFESQVRPEFEKLRGSGVSREDALKQIRARITKESWAWTLSTISSQFKSQRKESTTWTITDPVTWEVSTPWWVVLTPWTKPITDPKTWQVSTPWWTVLTPWTKPVSREWPTEEEALRLNQRAREAEQIEQQARVEEEAEAERVDTEAQKTLRERVAWQIAWRQTREEQLIAQREEAWRWELVELQKGFREEARAVQEDIENIRAWLEAEGWAITSIAASRIREARSAPLREQLVSLVKGQELTSASLNELDQSINWILEARKLDRQDEVSKLTAQIEASDLSSGEKNKLIWDLWVQTKRMQREEEIEAFRQKEEIKANIQAKDVESLQKTWLTSEQNLQAATIIQDFDVKEDSIAWQSVRNLLKEWKTPDQIRTLLWLAEDETGVIDDITFARQQTLRKEFEINPTIKNYLIATQQFAWILSTLWQESWPWDIASVFQFMKILDPSSVVRETEFATAASSSWILDRVTSLQILKKAESGQILTPKQRQQFAQIAKVLFENRKKAFDQRAIKFIRLSKEAWVNPRSVVLDFENVPWFASDLTVQDFAPVWQDSSDEEIIRMINKSWNTFTKESESSDIWNFLDDWWQGLDNADQPAEIKVEVQETITPWWKIGWILWPLQNKVTVVEKGWDNTVLWLSGWSLTFRTNNPLAITATGAWSAERLTNKFWAIPNLFSPDSADNLVLNFNTVEEWLRAGRQLLEEKRNLTLDRLAESHTWTSATWHKAQMQKMWLNLNRRFADLTEEEKNKVIEAFKIAEWFTIWKTIS